MGRIPLISYLKNLSEVKKSLFIGLMTVLGIRSNAQHLSGTVYSASDSLSIAGVHITVKGTYSGTFTDPNGAFKLNFGKSDSVRLQFTSIGYVPLEMMAVAGQKKLLQVYLQQTAYQKDEVVLKATRADRSTAMAYTDIDLETIESRNFGQDIPYLLQSEPGVVVTSDAGAGVGYTGIRIRGSDPTRINITVNGVPIPPTPPV